MASEDPTLCAEESLFVLLEAPWTPFLKAG